MFRIAICAAALFSVSTAGMAADAAKDGTAEADRVICKRMAKTGSRLPAPRECRTRAEWDAIEAQARDTAHKWQHTSDGRRQ